MKKFLALLLALAVVLSMVACGAKNEAPATTAATEPAVVYLDPYADLRDDYDALCEAIYLDVFADYYEAYQAAQAETSVSKRFALMAIAEAKLMESATILPLDADGGNYAMSAVAPNTASTALWGNMSVRYETALIATELIVPADRDALKSLWAELKGTGTYLTEAKAYLEGKGYTLQDSYTFGYNSDPKTWDYLNTYRSTDSEAIVNTVDHLVAYDAENVMQPALATEWTASEDGLTYTFTIRQGVKWVDSQGRELAELNAYDWVAAAQHLLDACGGTEYILGPGYANIVGVNEYLSGETTDFADVGVKALDDYTLQYTLTRPTSYFLTMLTYNPFSPMCKSYYESKGGKYGADFDSTAASYTYGKTPSDIAYCGPYLVKNFTEKNTIKFEANPAYWNAENVAIKTITWLYNDGEDTLKAYNDTKSGLLDGAGLNANCVEAAKADGLFEKYVYQAATGAISYTLWLGVNRHVEATHNYNDENAVVTPKTEDDMIRADAAKKNEHFRRAVAQALDRAAYQAQSVGEEMKYAAMTNSYTPGNYVFLEEEVTVDINGTPTTFAAGTYYGAIMQAQIDADGVALKVWDPEAEGGIGSSTQFDGWYNPEAAKAELAIAVEEMAALGIEISDENPIYLDLPVFTGSETYSNRAKALKMSIESVLGGAVIINLVECASQDEWLYAGYYCDISEQANFDIYDVSGWGPDYGDPSTYLNTMNIYNGDMISLVGLF